ncbi:MAG: class I SAM-dependent methyltransferase [Anaerolineae bacterium]|nr:class I SAM-dependent methyltransferase [Anaerolineae bacterium]
MSEELKITATNGGLDLSLLRRLAQRPPLFAPHQARFWDDPYISRQMLAAHLDPHTDAASRRPETIEAIVAWLVSHLGLQPGDAVLDLGCGPGLYASRLSRRGLRVTGVDFSPNSLDYARRQAWEDGLEIEYVQLNYLKLDYRERFDAAFLIYFDLAVLSDADRDEVVRRTRRALKPGGAFVFDVPTARWPRPPDGYQEWDVSAGGFWKPGPYLRLTQHFDYPEAEAQVQQTIVIEEDGTLSLYRIWDRSYSPETVTAMLEAQGFRVESLWADLTGRPLEPDSPALGVVARKEG